MLIQLITQHPEAIATVIQRTPSWVWGLLAGLLALGASQLFGRQMSLRRIAITPMAMLALALYGMASAFGASGRLGAVLGLWLIASAAVTALVMRISPPAGTRFEPASQSVAVPGSVVPMLLILGIFMTKYIVGVELGMQPQLTHDASFALPVALLYGAFNGIFAGRALRLLRLTRISSAVSFGSLGRAG